MSRTYQTELRVCRSTGKRSEAQNTSLFVARIRVERTKHGVGLRRSHHAIYYGVQQKIDTVDPQSPGRFGDPAIAVLVDPRFL